MNLKTTHPSLFIVVALLFSLLGYQPYTSGQAKKNKNNAPLTLTATIPLPYVSGRIDHMAFNSKLQVIYVAALANNTVEVVDVKNQKVVYSMKGLNEPQGIRYVPESNTIFVANAENGECSIFDANTNQFVRGFILDADADNVRYDSISKSILVGYGKGGIAITDAATFNKMVYVSLPAHPESFQVDETAQKVFVNIPNEHLVMVIDLEKKSIIRKWKITTASGNFPMALDATNQRLFIGCRHPAKILVLDTETGKVITSLNTHGDADDLYYDGVSKQIFISCGEGYIDVFKQSDQNNYEAVSKIETRPGARTSLFVPELRQLFVAAPSHVGEEAQLMVYKIN